MWFDAGIRDFLNASVSANQGVGGLMAKYRLPFGVYDGFAALAGARFEAAYDFLEVPWADLPQNGYVRYGNPDASAAEIIRRRRPPRRHAGADHQPRDVPRSRGSTSAGPRAIARRHLAAAGLKRTLMHTSPTTGRVSPFAVFLPPGYDNPENAGRALPGRLLPARLRPGAEGPVDLSALFANYMIEDQPLETRFQKFIIVYVDGRCRPQLDGVPVDPTAISARAARSTWTLRSAGTARMETNLLELMDHIDATYRTKRPSPAEVTP